MYALSWCPRVLVGASIYSRDRGQSRKSSLSVRSRDTDEFLATRTSATQADRQTVARQQEEPAMQEITPCLWFDTEAEAAANFFTLIFKNSRILEISRYGEGMHKPEGTALT